MNNPSSQNPLQPAAAQAASRLPPRWLRLSPVGLLAALALFFLVTPFLERFRQGQPVEVVLVTIVLVSAMLAVGARRRTLAVAALLVVPALTARWVGHFRPDSVSPALFLCPAILFLIFVVAHLLGFALRAPRVNGDVLAAGISAYLLLGFIWALAYALVAGLIPDSFLFNVGPHADTSMEGFTAFYFSFITLTTVGYGDIVPVSGVARMLAAMEAIAGLFYMAVLMARLVSLYSTHPPSPASPDKKI